MALMSVQISDDTKDAFLALCKGKGITASEAISRFAETAVKEKGFPFEAAEEDAFYSEENMSHLRRNIEEDKTGKTLMHKIDLEITEDA